MPVKESSGIHSMFLENHRNLNQNLAGLTSLFSEKITTSTDLDIIRIFRPKLKKTFANVDSLAEG